MNSGAERSEAGVGAAQTPNILYAEHFEPHVDKIFRFGGARRALVLDRVIREPENTRRAGERRPFTLIFREPRARDVLPEGLYEGQVEGGPSFSLYVAPIHTPQPDRQEYQAVFN